MQNQKHADLAEKAIIASIILDSTYVLPVLDQLTYTDFSDPRNSAIFEAFAYLSSNEMSIDYASVIARLEKKNKLSLAGGKEYIFDIANYVPINSDIETHIRIVKEASVERSFFEILSKLRSDASSGKLETQEILENAEKAIIDALNSNSNQNVHRIANVMTETFEIIENNKKNKGSITGLHTGYSVLNETIMGLQKQDLIVLAGRPGTGKTAFALNLAFNAARQSDAHVLIFSLEMGAAQLAMRLTSNASGVDNLRIRKGELTDTDNQNLALAKSILEGLNISFNDKAGVSISDVRSICRKEAQRQLDLVIIDYLQLMTGPGNSRQEEVANISRGLKELARELKVPVIALAQLSREVEKRSDKVPMMSDLRDSGSIEQDADIIGFLYQPVPEDGVESVGQNDIVLKIAKNRHGNINDIDLTFIKHLARFVARDSSSDFQNMDIPPSSMNYDI